MARPRPLHPSVSLLLGSAAALAGACTASSPEHRTMPPGSREEPGAEFLRGVSEERLRKTVRELVALGPRMGGTRSGDQAATYLAAAFEAAGLVTQTVDDPELDAFEVLRFDARATAGAETRELKDGTPALGSPSVSGRFALRFEAPGDAGAGRTESPWALVVPPGERPPQNAGEHVVLRALPGRERDDSTPVPRLRGSSTPLITLSRREWSWLEARRALPATLELELETRSPRASPRTVIATLPAAVQTPAPPILLFCAHGDSDSGGPGADDNASGEAVVLELARSFAHLAAVRGQAFPCELRFAVWGSEIHSTAAYRRRAAGSGELTRHRAVINFDQAGIGASRDCVYFEPDDVPLNGGLVGVLAEAAARYSGTPGCWTEFAGNGSMGGTDSYVFQEVDDLPAVPAVTVFSSAFGAPAAQDREGSRPEARPTPTPGRLRVDFSPVYHETGDRPENTTEREPFNMVWCTKLAGLAALAFLSSPP